MGHPPPRPQPDQLERVGGFWRRRAPTPVEVVTDAYVRSDDMEIEELEGLLDEAIRYDRIPSRLRKPPPPRPPPPRHRYPKPPPALR